MTDTSGGQEYSVAGARATARQALLSGFALTVPLIVTLLVIGFVVNTLSNVLNPLVMVLFDLTGAGLQASETPPALVKAITLLLFVTGVFALGLFVERRSGKEQIEAVADATIKRIPGVGSLYTSFDEMSEMLLDSDTQSFQEVVLVEHPTEYSYTVAFVTASTPATIEEATDNGEMVTLFMPMAPNPVMGGHVVHVPADRVHDVDMTVEEGVRSIVTSGVAIGEGSVETPIGTAGADGSLHPEPQSGFGSGRRPRPSNEEEGASPDTRESAYRDDIDPEHAQTPDSIARENGSAPAGSDADQPGDLGRANGTLGDDADHPDALEQSSGSVSRPVDAPADITSEPEEQN